MHSSKNNQQEKIKMYDKKLKYKILSIFEMCIRDRDMDEAIEAANEIASEHMEIVTKNAFEVMMKVRNAGAIFIGEYSSCLLYTSRCV